MTFEEFITRTNNASSREEVFHLFQQALKSLGYDSVVYSLLTDHASLGRKAGHGVTGNYPNDWMQYYSEKGYFHSDPIPRQAFFTADAYTWDQVIETSVLSHKQKRIMNEAQDAKLYSGAAVAIRGPNFEVAGVGLASLTPNLRPSTDILSLIRALSHQFHYAYSQFDVKAQTNSELIALKNSQRVVFTPREREIVSYCAEGKSIPVIAAILSVSLGTVKFHMQNVFRKLNVSDKQTAVLKAIRLGLISPTQVKELKIP